MTALLGIAGRAGAGKTVAGSVLIHAKWHNVKFAGPLKSMTRAFLMSAGASDREADRMIEGDLKETPIPFLGNKTPRYIMQTLGTDWGRDKIDGDLWVNIARNECAIWMEQGRNVFVDDVRFENEAQMIRDMGGRILHITRGGLPEMNHRSENGVAFVEGDIRHENAGSLEDLQGFMRYVFLMDEEPSQWADTF